MTSRLYVVLYHESLRNSLISCCQVTQTAPNAHEAIICSPAVEAQNSLPELEDSRYKNALEALQMQRYQQLLQQKQQLLQHEQQLLQQNQQIIQQQQNAPAHQVYIHSIALAMDFNHTCIH
jgi:hypothetical protein